MSGIFSIDLVTLASADSTTAPAITSNGWTSAPAIIDDYRIEGTNALLARASNTTAWTGFQVATQNFTTNDNHIFIWMNNQAPVSTDTKANGGLGVWLSSGNTTFVLTGTTPNNGDADSRNWFVDGSDTNNVGGYVCYVVDPRSAGTFDLGTPNIAAVSLIGVRNKTINAIANNRFSLVFDALRVGTGVRITSGSDADPVKFEDIYQSGSRTTGTLGDPAGIVSGAWGIVTSVAGTYYGAGKLRFGSGSQTTPTVFKDTNKSFVWRNFPVSSSFYEIQLTGSTTADTIFQLGELVNNVPSNGCTISAPSGSVWNLNVIPEVSASFRIYASTLSQMRQGTIRSGSVIKSSTLTSCGTLIVSGAATITGSAFSNNISLYGSSSLAVENSQSFANIVDNEFIGNNVAINLVSPGTYTFDALTFTDNTWDVWNTSGGQVTINAINNSNPVDAKVLNSVGSTTTINNTKQLTLTGIVSGSEVRIYSAGTTTELDGAETVENTFTYTYNYSPSTFIDIVVHNVNYVYYRVDNYELGDTNGTLPIQQVFDRNYSNP